MSTQPTIAVIVTTKNRPARLWDALTSVAAQSYPAVEAIVVNDGGIAVDDLIERYRATFGRPIQYVSVPSSRGVAAARNAGIAATSSDTFALLDDDDRFRPEHVARLAAALSGAADGVLAYDDVLIQLERRMDDGEFEVVSTCRFGLPYQRAIFDVEDYIVPSSMLFRRADYERAGGFDEALTICEDWDFLLRLRQFGRFVYHGEQIGVDYSFRLATTENFSAVFDVNRQATLDLLSRRYGLPPLVPKTFLDVALDLGFVPVPVAHATSASPPNSDAHSGDE